MSVVNEACRLRRKMVGALAGIVAIGAVLFVIIFSRPPASTNSNQVAPVPPVEKSAEVIHCKKSWSWDFVTNATRVEADPEMLNTLLEYIVMECKPNSVKRAELIVSTLDRLSSLSAKASGETALVATLDKSLSDGSDLLWQILVRRPEYVERYLDESNAYHEWNCRRLVTLLDRQQSASSTLVVAQLRKDAQRFNKAVHCLVKLSEGFAQKFPQEPPVPIEVRRLLGESARLVRYLYAMYENSPTEMSFDKETGGKLLQQLLANANRNINAHEEKAAKREAERAKLKEDVKKFEVRYLRGAIVAQLTRGDSADGTTVATYEWLLIDGSRVILVTTKPFQGQQYFDAKVIKVDTKRLQLAQDRGSFTVDVPVYSEVQAGSDYHSIATRLTSLEAEIALGNKELSESSYEAYENLLQNNFVAYVKGASTFVGQ